MVLHLLKEGTQLQASTHLLSRTIHPPQYSMGPHPRRNTTQVLTRPLPVDLTDLVDPVVILLIVALVAINPLLLLLGPRVTVPLEVIKVAHSTHLPPPEAHTRERPHHLSTSLQGAAGIILQEGTNPGRK
jgi:hypothetical protein